MKLFGWMTNYPISRMRPQSQALSKFPQCDAKRGTSLRYSDLPPEAISGGRVSWFFPGAAEC